MKKLSKIFVAAILLFAVTITANAQGNSLDLELNASLMKMDGKLYLFITDTKGTPYANNDITATAKFKDLNGKKQKSKLSAFGETAFVFDKSYDSFSKLVATLRLKKSPQDLIITATFDGKGTEENRFECPMHPSEMAKEQGKCAKCGMGLVAKKVTTYLPPVIIRKGSR
jgi:hypothetical protein